MKKGADRSAPFFSREGQFDCGSLDPGDGADGSVGAAGCGLECDSGLLTTGVAAIGAGSTL